MGNKIVKGKNPPPEVLRQQQIPSCTPQEKERRERFKIWEKDQNTRFIVTELVEAWNAGIREGSLQRSSVVMSPHRVKEVMASVGVVVYLYPKAKFEMKGDNNNNIQNPFEPAADE